MCFGVFVLPNFDRRGFMQMFGAAGLVPLMPALPATAVAATAPMPTSKALWAGIYSKAGSVPKFVDAARGMGLSNASIQGVSARTLGVRVSAAAAANQVSQVAGPRSGAVGQPAKLPKSPSEILRDIERRFTADLSEAELDHDAAKADQVEAPVDPATETPKQSD